MDLGLLAALSEWLDPAWWWAVLQVVFGLGFVIFVHELGHFLAAKACGVKCEKFYVGFDAFDIKIGDRVIVPRKLLHWQRGETEYGVGILPLGGYVKMLGQDDNPSKMAEERELAMNEEGDGVDGTSLDPRSYIAKTVPQRMLIISAGVIMNLIFAVIFAALAFRSGVNYEPPKVGKTVPGSPAWVNNLDGSTINEISGYRTDNPDVYFTFNHLRELIVLDSYDGPLQMEVARPGSDAPTDESIDAVKALIGIKGGKNLKSLGIAPMLGTTLASQPCLDGQAAMDSQPPLEGGDQFVEIEGVKISDGYEMIRTLAQYPDKAVKVKVRRGGEDGKIVDITMPANPSKWVGLTMEIGPVTAVRMGSEAEKAGLKSGMTIVKIDGQPVGDVFTLQQRMLKKARDKTSVQLTVIEGDDNVEKNLTIKPESPRSPTLLNPLTGMSIESLGITLVVKGVIKTSQLTGENAPRPGDKIVGGRIELSDRQSKLVSHENLEKPFNLEKDPNSWAIIQHNLQVLDVGTNLILNVVRGETEVEVVANVEMQDGFFQETRGFIPVPEQQFYQDKSVWAATKNGFRQTIDDASRVLKFLKKLVRGQLSPTNFGGPGTIAAVATSEASRGTSRLLLFLTLLSANLAIINFLPIPVLDGGHMVFLAYEGIFRRPVPEKMQIALTIAGFVFLLGLMIMVIGMDVWRLAF